MTSPIEKLLSKTTDATIKAAAWAKDNDLGSKLIITGATVGAIGMIYSFGAAAVGTNLDAKELLSRGQEGFEIYRTRQLDYATNAIGNGPKAEAISDLLSSLKAALSAPLWENSLVEAWRGLSITTSGAATIVTGVLAKIGLNNVADSLELADRALAEARRQRLIGREITPEQFEEGFRQQLYVRPPHNRG